MSSPERAEFGSPIPLSDIEDVLSWVDTFKLSRPTKKINRDFADAVLLAEMLASFYPKLVEMHNYPPRNSQAQKLNNWMTLNRKVLKKLKLNLCIKTMEQLSNSIPGAVERVLIMVLLVEMLAGFYPKLVEMHNYPPRNSQAQKLNNWMTLNRKVLKKLKLNLCIKTMEQLSNSIPGAVERVLIMVRDKIKRDEENSRSEEKDFDQNASSGGSYYEACSEEDNVLVVPVKQRCGGTLEMVQKKVVSHEVYLGVREQLRDAREANETLKQKVDHLGDLIKIKIERIEELQQQLSRKASRRKETEDLKNTLSVPISLTEPPPSPKIDPKYNVSQDMSIEKELESVNLELSNTGLKEKQDNSNVEYAIIDKKSKDNTAGINENNFDTTVEIPNKSNDDVGEIHKKIYDKIAESRKKSYDDVAEIHETDVLKAEEPDLKEIKDRKSETKTELKSRIPILEKPSVEPKPQMPKHIIESAISTENHEILNCQGEEDEMTFYN